MKPLKSLQALIESFEKLPGVGSKSAERMAQAILEFSVEDVVQFQASLGAVKANVHACPTCGLLTEEAQCEICSSSRSYETLVVVSYSKDVVAFEKLEETPYRYHVLGGVLSASKGFAMEHLNIDSLKKRIQTNPVKEIILATNPTLEGVATAKFISTLLAKEGLTICRIGYGLPMGGHVDYADALTLSKAVLGRTNLKGVK